MMFSVSFQSSAQTVKATNSHLFRFFLIVFLTGFYLIYQACNAFTVPLVLQISMGDKQISHFKGDGPMKYLNLLDYF